MNRPTVTPPPADEAYTLPPALRAVRRAIIACEACPRLRAWCARVAREKRPASRNDTYWARPVPGFGDPAARIVLLGLAPAAHGANRTGRMFTGDVPGGSSDFLMAAMHACGLASLPTSRAIDDGLRLNNVWMTATARCAPPDNALLPGEIRNCFPHLVAETDALPHARVYVALGRVAFDTLRKLFERRRLFERRGTTTPRRPVFEHGAVYRYDEGVVMVASYHPSRQNTQTGRLTPVMLRQVLRRAKTLAAF